MNENNNLATSIGKLIENFNSNELKHNVRLWKESLLNKTKDDLFEILNSNNTSKDLLQTAISVKPLIGQINIIIHALGIMHSLPYILESDETIESVSLGADSSSGEFDLETNLRVAEFKFIDWKGKDSMRLQNTFKDYYQLAIAPTDKIKYLYLTDATLFLTFLNGNRKVGKILRSYSKVSENMSSLYKEMAMREFCSHVGSVEIVSLSKKYPDIFN